MIVSLSWPLILPILWWLICCCVLAQGEMRVEETYNCFSRTVQKKKRHGKYGLSSIKFRKTIMVSQAVCMFVSPAMRDPFWRFPHLKNTCFFLSENWHVAFCLFAYVYWFCIYAIYVCVCIFVCVFICLCICLTILWWGKWGVQQWSQLKNGMHPVFQHIFFLLSSLQSPSNLHFNSSACARCCS